MVDRKMGGETSVAEAQKPFRLKAYDLGLRPGTDPDKLNKLVDELEIEECLARERERNG